MSFVGSNILAGASGQGGAGFKIDRSLRFNPSDSPSLSKTFSTAGNRQAWSWSAWVKKAANGKTADQCLFGGYTASNDTDWFEFGFGGSNDHNPVDTFYWTTNNITSSSTPVFRDNSAWYHCLVRYNGSNIKVYVNSTEVLTYSKTGNLGINGNWHHSIGRSPNSATTRAFDGYLADVHFIDGQALAPTDFGEYDDNNVWQPKEFTGSYTSTNTSTTLTQTGWDPSTTNAGNHTLIWDGSTTNKAYGYNGNSIGTVTFSPPLTGVIKVECYTQDYNHYLNGTTIATPESVNGGWHTYYDSSTPITLNSLGNSYSNNTQTVDLAAIRINGTIIDSNTWTPPSGVGVQSSGANSFYLKFADNSSNAALGTDSSGNNNTFTVNNLIATAGLETANQGMDVVTYTGNHPTGQSITNLSFQPDFVWIKDRSGTNWHYIFDSVRGVEKAIFSNATNAENTYSNTLTAFNSNGFTLGSDNATNQSSNNYVAWCWKAGGSASSNTDGTITSSVSANSTYGFSICTYTGTGSNATVGHGLSSAPKWIIVKDRSQATGWSVYHSTIGTSSSNYIELQDSAGSSQDNTAFQNTAPTNSVFSIGTKAAVNTSGDNFVAYCWSEISGFSKFGSVSAGSDPVVTTGFKPRYVLLKRTDAAGNWRIFDTARGSGTTQIWLEPNSSGAEHNNANGQFVFRDDGFQLIGSYIDVGTVLYAAFADKPPGEIIDSLIDTPTNADTPTDTGAGGEVVGNYATWNPLDKDNTVSYTNGNLEAAVNAGSTNSTYGTVSISSGKWYWEVVISGGNGSSSMIGVAEANKGTARRWTGANGWYYYETGVLYNNTTSTSYGASYTNGDVIGVTLDMDNGNLVFYKNGSSQGTAYSTGTFSGKQIMPAIGNGGGANVTYTVNFGQRPFAYTAPSGFKSLCTTNLPDPTIADSSKYFDAKIFTGDGSAKTVTGYQFEPDMIWLKNRSISAKHEIVDAVRGVDSMLFPSNVQAESTSTLRFTSFNSDGFTIGTSSNSAPNGNSNVAWAWDGGSSTVSNTDGSITSSVSANPSAGFSIVKWTGNRSASTVGHGLNAAVKFFFVKNIDQSSDWITFHSELGGGQGFIRLNTNGAAGNASSPWNSTVPTSSVFSLGADSETNGNGDEMIAYCFAPVEGYSAFGSYTGNGSADGPFVYTGFRPAFVIAKRSSGANGDWIMHDTIRTTANGTGDNNTLVANVNAAEDAYYTASQVSVDYLSNGFKTRHAGGPLNDSTYTYIYIAFADSPFKTARAR